MTRQDRQRGKEVVPQSGIERRRDLHAMDRQRIGLARQDKLLCLQPLELGYEVGARPVRPRDEGRGCLESPFYRWPHAPPEQPTEQIAAEPGRRWMPGAPRLVQAGTHQRDERRRGEVQVGHAFAHGPPFGFRPTRPLGGRDFTAQGLEAKQGALELVNDGLEFWVHSSGLYASTPNPQTPTPNLSCRREWVGNWELGIGRWRYATSRPGRSPGCRR